MATVLSFTFEGVPTIQRRLEGIDARAVDASPAFNAMGDSLRLAEVKQFNSEGAYGAGGQAGYASGSKWAPLSPAYEAWKSQHYPGKGILVRTGALRNSLTKRPFGIDEVHPTHVQFGSGLPYGIFHQKGTSKMPARPVISLPETLRREWVKILQRWLVTGALK